MKFYIILPTECIYMFVYGCQKSDCFPLQHQHVVFMTFGVFTARCKLNL